MRQVAVDAQVDPALVRHFFGGKEQLFAEVAASVIRPQEAVATLAAGPRDRLGERLSRYFLGLLGDLDRPGPLLGLIRSAVTSAHAATVMREFLARELLAPVAEQVRVDAPQLRTALAASQLVGLAVARYAVGLPALTRTDTEDLVGWVAPTLQRYLTGSPSSAGTPHASASAGPPAPARDPQEDP